MFIFLILAFITLCAGSHAAKNVETNNTNKTLKIFSIKKDENVSKHNKKLDFFFKSHKLRSFDSDLLSSFNHYANNKSSKKIEIGIEAPLSSKAYLSTSVSFSNFSKIKDASSEVVAKSSGLAGKYSVNVTLKYKF